MRKYVLILAAGLITGCAHKTGFDRSEVEKVLQDQAAAWNRGDIEGYMQGYWNNDSVRFVSARAITYGWKPLLERYKKSYPDKAAIGRLEFELPHIEPIEDRHAQVTGKWTLYRQSDTLGGHFQLLLRNFDDGWKIVVDATS